MTTPAADLGYPEPLGVTVISSETGSGLNIAVHARGATAVEFCFFDGHTEQRVMLPGHTADVFHGQVAGLGLGTRYGFRVHGPWGPHGIRFNPAKLLMDPYARLVEGAFVDHPAVRDSGPTPDQHDSAPFVPRCVVVDTSYDWSAHRKPATALADHVIYEVHVKGFTQRHPDIPEELRGTYAGMAHPASIDYLVKLGVTAVELLPIHQFVDEPHLQEKGLTNYWGYNTLGFFAPHSAYAATSDPVREFKDLVRALHEANISVILDVVYNHTCEGDHNGPILSFRGLSTDYYLTNPDGTSRDATGCGNTFNANSPAALRLVMDSLRYWVNDMQVDGFRFDLATSLARTASGIDINGPLMSAIKQDPLLREALLIAEPWDVGPEGYRVGAWPYPWAEWNDRFRDSVRDFWRGSAHGLQELGWRLTGSADIFSPSDRAPYSSINFVTAHDGFCLRDVVSYESKHNELNGEDNRDGTDNNRSANHGVEGETTDTEVLRLRRRQMRNLLSTLLLSSGTPMLVAGDEYGRTQQGNNNAYCHDNELTWLSWDREPWQRLLQDFTAQLIQLRRSHSVFRRRRFFTGTPMHGGAEDLAWLDTNGMPFTERHWHRGDQRTFAMFLNGGPHEESFLAVFNGSPEWVRFTLPDQPYGTSYRRIFDTVDETHSLVPWIDLAGEHVVVSPHTMMLFACRDTAAQ